MRSMPAAGEDAGLLGKLVWRARVQPSADAAVLALRVLAHADHVDVRGAAVGQRRGDAGQQPHRPQVDVLPQRWRSGRIRSRAEM